MEINNAIQGWYNHITNKPMTSIQKNRLTICNECKNTRRGKSSVCSLCGCNIKAKIKSNSKCPISLW